MAQDNFDVIVIGAGPGGYVCAIRAAQLGMRVASIDSRGSPGGTCLNIGCIPSKALLHATHMFHAAQHFDNLGIDVSSPKLNLSAMMAFKQKAIDGNTQGVQFLLKKNKIEEIIGVGELAGKGEVRVALNSGGERVLRAQHIVIASGSETSPLAGVDIDEAQIVSSSGALCFESVPGELLVIGAGVIGLELGSVWARLGSKVTVVEYLARILPGVDGEIAKGFQRILKKQGLSFLLGQKVVSAKREKSRVEVEIEAVSDGASVAHQFDKVLVAIGRRAFTQGLGLKPAGVEVDSHGRVVVDKHFATSAKGIYAIGDAITGPMLAHKAEDEGMALAEYLAHGGGHVRYDTIPSVIYTHPEIAFVGASEESLKEQKIAYCVGKYPFLANGRAKVNQTSDGFVKILADASSDKILGAHIMGPQAGELIAELVLAMEFSASAEDVARTCHAHPTLSEAVKEAALAVAERAIHM